MIETAFDVAIAVLGILLLVALHEFGHFFLAKVFGVNVEEFGIGIPPRVFGKKIGKTIYSINALPLGAFVRMEGEEKRVATPVSFSAKPVWQRIFIVGGGVLAFWIVAALLFSVLGATSGIPMGVGDNDARFISGPQIQITGISPRSPAEFAKLELGDVVKDFTTVSDFQKFTNEHKGKEITLHIQRAAKQLTIFVTPRKNPPIGQGPLGVALSRIAFVHIPWYFSPVEGVRITEQFTLQVLEGFWNLGKALFQGKGLPQGVQVSGPVGIVSILTNTLAFGPASFFAMLATLSVYLAVFNVLPIPAVDGGRLLFLVVEFFRRKPLPEQVEHRMIAISFGILFFLFVLVTIKDIANLL